MSLVLSVMFIDRIASHGEEEVWFGKFRASSLLFVYDVFLMASSCHDPHYGGFAAKCEAAESQLL